MAPKHAIWYAEAKQLILASLQDSISSQRTWSGPELNSAAARYLLSGGVRDGDLLALTVGRNVRVVTRVEGLAPGSVDLRLVQLPHLSLPERLSASPTLTQVNQPDDLAAFQFPIEALLIAPATAPAAALEERPPELTSPIGELEAPLAFGPSGAPHNLLLYGPPGTGKTFSLKRRALGLVTGAVPQGDSAHERVLLDRLWRQASAGGQVAMCTFHQAYTYEEFVEGIRPVTNDGRIGYKTEDGLFKRMALLALADALPGVPRSASPDDRIAAAKQALQDNRLPTRGAFDAARPYVLVIDEINRANISRVMGELITLLEGEKRVGGDDPLLVTLPTSKERFAVPPNLHVIGTLNTADRSIALMDVALRRRFTFEEMRPDLRVLQRHFEALPEVGPLAIELFQKLNERLLFLYDREHQIGHAYFLKVDSIFGLRNVMVKKVLPLLQEYFFGQWNRVALVLGHPMKPAGHEPVVFGEKVPAILTVRRVREDETIGFNHDDYADTFEYKVHPTFIESSDAAWVAKALWSMMAPVPDEKKRDERVEQLRGAAGKAAPPTDAASGP
jgi:hypothetical protein